MKTLDCRRCLKILPEDDFHRNRGRRRGRVLWCKSCKRETQRPNYEYSKERNLQLRKKFGITIDTYNVMLTTQDGVCALCQQPCPSGRQLAVDHDHETGKVRGLLCCNCNRALGLLKRAEVCRRATDYLEGNL